MKLLRNKKGFTLLEILIVLVILGVVAGLMFPVLAAQVERSRAQEAYTALGTVREAAIKFYQTRTDNDPNSYGSMSFARLGYDPNVGAAGQTPLFTYNFVDAGGATIVPAVGAQTFICRAVRNGLTAADWIEITEAGVVRPNGVYA